MHLIPSPRILAAPLRLLPEPLLRRGSAKVIAHVLATPLAEGRLDDFAGRRIGVEVTDLGLRWIVAFGERRVDVLEQRDSLGPRVPHRIGEEGERGHEEGDLQADEHAPAAKERG